MELRAPREVHSDGVLPRGHADDRRRRREQARVGDEVRDAQRGAHDDQLQRRADALGRQRAPQRDNAGEQTCGQGCPGLTGLGSLWQQRKSRHSAGKKQQKYSRDEIEMKHRPV